MHVRRLSIAALGAMFLVAGSGSFVGPTRAAHTGDAILPDLAMLPPSDFRIVIRDSGRRLLRFSTIAVNVGEGPLQIYGFDADGPGGSDAITVRQQLLEPDGTFSEHRTWATMFWGGDGHDHFHVRGGQKWKLQNLNARTLRSGMKTGFCFLDSYRFRATTDPRYTGANHVCQLADGRIEMGISPDWGDIYRYDVKYQWVDITGLPNGQYRLKVIIDPPFKSGGRFIESNETNNRAWVRLDIRRSSVTVLASSSQP